MRAVRSLLIVAGICAWLYGGWRLLDEPEALLSVAKWVVGPVLIHDALFAPVIVALGWLAARVVRPWWRAPLLVGALVSGALTVIALPLLAKPGARPDNTSLLDRDYVTGWLVALAVVWAAVAAWLVLASSRQMASPQPPAGDTRDE